MTKLAGTTIKISLMMPILFFSYSFCFFAFANELDNPVNEYDSMYQYHALQNKVSFFNIVNNADNPEEQLSENNLVTYDDTEKLQDITKQQNFSIEKSDNAISAIEDRNGVTTFFLGNKLGILKFQMVQMKDQSYALSTLALKTEDHIIKGQINNQIDILKQQQVKVENFILLQEDRFNLFGWLIASL